MANPHFREWLEKPLRFPNWPMAQWTSFVWPAAYLSSLWASPLPQYADQLKAHGYGSTEKLISLTEPEIEVMFLLVGIQKEGHRLYLTEKIKELKTNTTGVSF